MTPTPSDTFLMVFGTRTFADYDLLRERLDWYTQHLVPLTVVTGEWRGIGYGTPNYIGADLLAERWAASRRFPYRRFPPPFDLHPNTKQGRAGAMHQRNREMVEFIAACSDGHAFGFWDGVSPGTASVIELLRKHNVPHKVHRYAE